MDIMNLESFVHKISTDGSTTDLQLYWDDFVNSFGAIGYRITPATVNLLQRLYPLIEIKNKPRLTFQRPFRQSIDQPNTVIDLAHKTSPGWREFYNEHHLYRYDPILLKEIIHRGPFTRQEALAEFNSPETKKLIALTQEFGHNENITMSHWLGPDLLVGVSLYFPSIDINLDNRTKRVMQTASFLFCTRYQEINTPINKILEGPTLLTPRELDVLHWIALGRSKQEIAEKLSVSISCIKRHCENATRKLEVNNMASAVARAMSYGLINI